MNLTHPLPRSLTFGLLRGVFGVAALVGVAFLPSPASALQDDEVPPVLENPTDCQPDECIPPDDDDETPDCEDECPPPEGCPEDEPATEDCIPPGHPCPEALSPVPPEDDDCPPDDDCPDVVILDLQSGDRPVDEDDCPDDDCPSEEGQPIVELRSGDRPVDEDDCPDDTPDCDPEVEDCGDTPGRTPEPVDPPVRAEPTFTG